MTRRARKKSTTVHVLVVRRSINAHAHVHNAKRIKRRKKSIPIDTTVYIDQFQHRNKKPKASISN